MLTLHSKPQISKGEFTMNKPLTMLSEAAMPVIAALTRTGLGERVPRLIKRKFLMISAFALFKNIDTPSDEVFKTVKNLFKVKQDPFILVALRLKSYTWKEIGVNGMIVNNRVIYMDDIDYRSMSEQEKMNLADAVIERTPKWLIYGSKELLRHDLSAVLDSICRKDNTTTIVGA